MANKKQSPPPSNRGGNHRNNEVAARVLAEAAFYGGGAKVAEKHGFSSRSYLNWLEALDTDKQLSALYLKALSDLAHQSWAEDLNASVRRTLEKITSMIETLEPTAENIKLALTALQQLSDLELTRYGIANATAHQGTATGYTGQSAETPAASTHPQA
jgi:hypothetical protein